MPHGILLLFSLSYLFFSTAPCFLLLLCTGMSSSMDCSPPGVSLLQPRTAMAALFSTSFILVACPLPYVSSASFSIFPKTTPLHSSTLVSLSYVSSLLSCCVSFCVFLHISSSESTTPTPCSFHPFSNMSEGWCCVFSSPASVLGHSGVFPSAAKPRTHGLLPHRC